DQIAAEWQRLKTNQTLAHLGHTACDQVTELELTKDAVGALILKRLTDDESFLKRQVWFTDFETWPADAQLGLLSMAWAMGPGGPGAFPHFRAACQRQDFKTAAMECKMDEAGNPGLVPRNHANSALFSNAAAIANTGVATLQRSHLYYPQAL